jgi:hypothetical protein
VSDPAATGPAVRPVIPAMRTVFVVGSVLVFAAGFQLYVLTDHTDRFFAWTIGVPFTAAFLGAFYWTALVLAASSAREREWARVRVGVPGVALFVALTLIVSVVHVGSFHLHGGSVVGRVGAWVWFAVYAIAPVGAFVALIAQLRAPGFDPPRRTRLPGPYRLALASHALVVLIVGGALMFAPNAIANVWPWALTPLTARAMAAWLLGLGVVLAQAVFEDAPERIELAARSYAVLGLLELVAVARYASAVDWSEAAAWLYLAFLMTVVGVGVAGWAASRTSKAGSLAQTS